MDNAYIIWAANDRVLMKRLQVPVALAAGLYEHLTDEELNDHYNDITAERARRAG